MRILTEKSPCTFDFERNECWVLFTIGAARFYTAIQHKDSFCAIRCITISDCFLCVSSSMRPLFSARQSLSSCVSDQRWILQQRMP